MSFTLSPEELAADCDRRGEFNQLGPALHLCVVKMTGRSQLSTNMVPKVDLLQTF
ncbi:DUF4158 domain-containing protein [Shimia sediminis]|uniref:DUF4158 domain-containing protein n=1 Tax=Shimia sediminis TaxID=2497945 RepID=UPI0034D2DF87